MEYIDPNEQRAKWAISLIGIIFIIEIFALFFDFQQYSFTRKVVNGGVFDKYSVERVDKKLIFLSKVFIVTFSISSVTFILWFRRAYYNLHRKTPYLTFSEGWAAGSWFVPILNLIRPYQIMKEIYVETKALLVRKEIIIKQKLSVRIVNWWWGLWIAFAVITRYSNYFRTYPGSLEGLQHGYGAAMLGDLVGIALSLITIKMIYDYSKVDPLLIDLEDESELIPLTSETL